MALKSAGLAFEPPHPGEYIKEDILPALDMNATQLADHLGVSKQTVSNILNGKRPLSTDMAVRLGKAFKNGGRFWLALQMQHDLWHAERKGGAAVKPIDWTDDRAA